MALKSFLYNKPRKRGFSASVLCGHAVGVFVLSSFLTKLILLTEKKKKKAEDCLNKKRCHLKVTSSIRKNSWCVNIGILQLFSLDVVFKAEGWAPQYTSVIPAFTRP